MILHRLMLEDFRGVVREEVELEPRGVLVIEGPNESGKTSLMDALETVSYTHLTLPTNREV